MKPKDIRKQLRNICKESMPEIMIQEFYVQLEKTLVLKFQEHLSRIETRQKQLQSYIIRSASESK